MKKIISFTSCLLLFLAQIGYAQTDEKAIEMQFNQLESDWVINTDVLQIPAVDPAAPANYPTNSLSLGQSQSSSSVKYRVCNGHTQTFFLDTPDWSYASAQEHLTSV